MYSLDSYKINYENIIMAFTVAQLDNNALAFHNALLVKSYPEKYAMLNGKLAYIKSVPTTLEETITMKGPDRMLYCAPIGDIVILEPVEAGKCSVCHNLLLKAVMVSAQKGDKQHILETNEFIKTITNKLAGCTVNPGQDYAVELNSGETFKLTVVKFDGAIINIDTVINIQYDANPKFALTIANPLKNFNYADLGIGGLEEEFKTIFRAVFMSRSVPENVAKVLKIKHTKGIILHGPPGCGKTLIARKIGQMLNVATTKIVNGPELVDKWLGSSEKNIRELFKSAEDDPQRLHLIIIDEIDSICSKRPTGNLDCPSANLRMQMVNQFLSKIDGVQEINNILIIGLTNRFDQLDPAIIRSGRLDLHVKINLPNVAARKQILEIYTKNLHMLGWYGDICIDTLAELTDTYSGSDLENLVKRAVEYSIMRSRMMTDASVDEMAKQSLTMPNMKVDMEDFIHCIKK